MTLDLRAALADCDDEFAALDAMGAIAPDARLISASGTRWFAPGWDATQSAVGAYAAALAVNRFHRESGAAVLAATVGGAPLAFAAHDTDRHDSGVRFEPIDATRVPAIADAADLADSATRRWHALLLTLEVEYVASLAPQIGPTPLSHLADRVAAAYPGTGGRATRSTRFARGRSSFPFHEFEALTHAPRLAAADALDAVRTVRDELETCDIVFAERWAQLIAIDLTDETALSPDPSPVGAMAFSPDAHMLADWLELSVDELAQGRGNLVVLGRRFAEDTELVAAADDPGAMAAARPITADPWVLWLFDVGGVQRFRLRTGGTAPETA